MGTHDSFLQVEPLFCFNRRYFFLEQCVLNFTEHKNYLGSLLKQAWGCLGICIPCRSGDHTWSRLFQIYTHTVGQLAGHEHSDRRGAQGRTGGGEPRCRGQ